MRLLTKWIEPVGVATVLLFGAAIAYGQAVKGPYITTADTQVRKGPGTNHPVITTIPKDIKINVVGKEGSWLKIESKHGNQPGYIEERYARPLEAKSAAPSKSAPSLAGTYRTITEVDLREGPGTQHRIMQKLPEGIKVNVVRAEGDWLRIESKRGNRPGYVEKRFLERVVE
ncbi:MAG TPA: SH3 domain-containing protein [Candidatus Eisenbacteria bacterium]|nr:SH3 domain-containing protein [Candidatus Eisenbacteria bacterium]